MKKIGLCVCYDTYNFGSQLQVLATIKKIEELGYNTEIIVYKKQISIKFLIQTLPRLFNPYFLKGKLNGLLKKIKLLRHSNIKKQIMIRNKKFSEFAKNNFINMSIPYVGWKELVVKANKNYDIFLCGSDQLWLPSNLGSHFYTLEFVNKCKKKISYATSFGVSNIPWYQKKNTKQYLEAINFVSIREEAGKKIIEQISNKIAKVVCDPTLLFSKEEWQKVIEEEKLMNEKYIFCYFLGNNNEHRKVAEELSDKTNLKIITIPYLDDFNEAEIEFGDEKLFNVNAKDFINLIRNAEYVLTDSFHGSIFSIINHKKFVVFDRFSNKSKNSRNSRIDNLCNLFELNSRRYKENIYTTIEAEIDYTKVDKLVQNFREESIKWLIEALRGDKINENIK